MRSETRTLIIANLFGFIAVLAVNYLANALPLGGNSTGELSDRYPNLIVPAGLTFSIWSIIYSWLGVWIVYQVMALFNPSIRERVAPAVDKTGWLFFATCVFNIAWLFAWHYRQVGYSVFIMIALLAALIALNRAAGVGSSKVSGQEKWMAHPPYGIYQGWITVALVTNVAAFLVDQGWRGGPLPEATWAVVMIAVAAALAAYVVRGTNNVFHGLAVTWACVGIFLKPYVDDDAPSDPVVGYAALAAGLLVLIVVVWQWRRWNAY
jgi:hypothetical protein